MPRAKTTSAATRLGKLEERIAELRRVRAREASLVVAYADDDADAVARYVAELERCGGLVVVIRSLAPRPASEPAPWAR